MKQARPVLINIAAAAAIGAIAFVVASVPSLPRQPVFSDAGEADLHPVRVLENGSGRTAGGTEPAASRAIAPDIVAPPEVPGLGLERIEARPPLGELGLAAPPKPVKPDDWRGTVLYRPVVTSSASFEAMGYTILVAGTEPIRPDQSCDFAGGMALWRACQARLPLLVARPRTAVPGVSAGREAAGCGRMQAWQTGCRSLAGCQWLGLRAPRRRLRKGRGRRAQGEDGCVRATRLSLPGHSNQRSGLLLCRYDATFDRFGQTVRNRTRNVSFSTGRSIRPWSGGIWRGHFWYGQYGWHFCGGGARYAGLGTAACVVIAAGAAALLFQGRLTAYSGAE
ncbi:hypothetical protein SLT36_29615 (plasmid) [Aminobacter sp. BA135]|uniref:hypothetical protein n=1 Tax=Aminobacter sp. BA135 TaxID=537596 RepID=UPI003D78C1E5